MSDESIEEKEAKLAAFMHGGFDQRLRSVFESVKGGNPLPVDRGVLVAAIDDLYAAFGQRHLSQPFRHCNHCVSEAMVTHWRKDPLKSLSADDLWAVMSNVPATAGSIEDVLYFTPRVLEHAALEPCILDLSWAFSSLQNAGAPQTTDREKQALQAYFEPIWASLRDSDPHHPLGIRNIVLPTAVLTSDISHYLDLWLGSKAAVLYSSRTDDAFWDKRSKAYDGVTTWLNEHRGGVG